MRIREGVQGLAIHPGVDIPNTLTEGGGCVKARARSEALFQERLRDVQARTARVFGVLLVAEWLGAVILALWVSPLTWVGATSSTNPHVWAAVLGGGVVISLPVYLSLIRPAAAATRFCIGLAQMLIGGLLIHLTGGRIETHFHVFVSLAFLSLFRDWRVLIVASTVTAIDHLVRGSLWPRSVFGVTSGAEWRWLEHAAWVAFEDLFLIWSCQRGLAEMRVLATSQIEQARQAEQFRQLLESSGEGILGIDALGQCTFINRCGEDLLGVPGQDILGRNLAELIHFRKENDSTPGVEEAAIFSAFREGRECRVTGEDLRRKDGSSFPAEYSSHPMGEGGTIQGAVITFNDISERLRAEEEARKAHVAEAANRTKSEFLANMSHELRTPLNSVIGFANILMKNKPGNLRDQDLTYLGRILDNGKHLLSLINQVLDLAKVEAGRMEVELVAVQLPQLVGETLTAVEGNLKNRDVHLVSDVPDPLAPLRTDFIKLKQILINLVGNALKFTDKGSVTIRVRARPGDHLPVAIEVIDTGVGIPADKIDKVFQAFQQADNTTSRKYGGTGLGLTIARSLSELLGYHIEVESEVGKGSTFRIVLSPAGSKPARTSRSIPIPVAVQPTRILEAASAPISPSEGTVVLVIDDELDARTLMMHYLEECGCRVLTAGCGVHGLRMAREFRPSLITLDLMMPGMDGFQVLRALKVDPDLCDIPVVVVSIVASERRGLLLGAVDVMDKPVSRESLQNLLERNQLHGKGKVLVIEENSNARSKLAEALRQETLDVRLALNGDDALRLMDDYCPDVILLDLKTEDRSGWDFLERLRQGRKCPSSQVIVMTAVDLCDARMEDLCTQVRAVLKKEGEFVAELKQVVGEVLERKKASRCLCP
jgi:two-component system sensor histidine kinase/response regulator